MTWWPWGCQQLVVCRACSGVLDDVWVCRGGLQVMMMVMVVMVKAVVVAIRSLSVLEVLPKFPVEESTV